LRGVREGPAKKKCPQHKIEAKAYGRGRGRGKIGSDIKKGGCDATKNGMVLLKVGKRTGQNKVIWPGAGSGEGGGGKMKTGGGKKDRSKLSVRREESGRETGKNHSYQKSRSYGVCTKREEPLHSKIP